MRRKADFEELLRRGEKRSAAGYVFYLRQRDGGKPRLGILVSLRHSRAATQRNRLKRCIREAFRMEQEHLGSVDLLVRPPYGMKPSADMILHLRKLLCALKR